MSCNFRFNEIWYGYTYICVYIYIYIYIYMGAFPLTLCVTKKNLIMFYLFFCIFLYLLICGNPSKKSHKTLIPFKHVL